MFSFLNYRIYLNYNFRTTVFCPVSCCSCWFPCSKSCTPQSTPILREDLSSLPLHYGYRVVPLCQVQPITLSQTLPRVTWSLRLGGTLLCRSHPGNCDPPRRAVMTFSMAFFLVLLSLSLPLWNCVLVCLWGCLFFRVANGVFVWGFSFQFWRHSMWVNFPALRVFFLMFLRLQSPK